MRKLIITLCMIGSVVILLDTINFGQQFILFIFAGIVPGTNIIIAPIDFMAATATAITVIVLRITVWSLVRSIVEADPKTHHKTA